MTDFKKLKIWQKAIEISTWIYKVTKEFPTEERFGLVSQMTRCAVSIPSNIAEGAGRESKKEFQQFLNIAVGSSYELETQLTICRNVGLINEDLFQKLYLQIIELQKMMRAFKDTLKKNITL